MDENLKVEMNSNVNLDLMIEVTSKLDSELEPELMLEMDVWGCSWSSNCSWH